MSLMTVGNYRSAGSLLLKWLAVRWGHGRGQEHLGYLSYPAADQPRLVFLVAEQVSETEEKQRGSLRPRPRAV